MAKANAETRQFEAEVQQILQLMIHSLYSNREIFLRELISNASDACDRLHFATLKDETLLQGEGDLAIRISADKEAGTVTVSDNGIGMSYQEVIDNLGTIASSGTKRFLESLSGDERKDADLIGQFGVGFYSSFIVAEQVTVETRRADEDKGVRWQSDGSGEFTIEEIERSERGTTITLKLRDDAEEFQAPERLRHIIRRYSDHIGRPILMPSDEEGQDWEKVNEAAALWTRSKEELEDKDYEGFYQHLTHDPEEPLDWTHNHVEGRQSYSLLMYIPRRAPFDLWDRERRRGIRLYVRRVFIMDEAEQLMPGWLRFVRGVVDSADLPLNVSREILQDNRLVRSIRAGAVKKVLGLLEDMARNRPDDYAHFWEQFGKVLKEGPAEDPDNTDRIAKLLRFSSTREPDGETVSLQDYVDRMKPDQKAIYYVTADNHETALNSPHLEAFRKQNVEVLLLSDRVDEWLVANLTEFDGKPLRSVTHGELEADEVGDSKDDEAKDERHKPLLDKLKGQLEDQVSDVRVSRRLVDSPACLVAEQGGLSLNLQRLLKEAGQTVPELRPILEVNPDHPLVRQLSELEDEARLGDWSQLLFDQALLAEGGQLADPAGFVRRLNAMLTGQSRQSEQA
ncbi:molecular chaperone HtpG [Natronospira proteinivora]|uniref:Chaperone protein HtpG n=1 Tax=Natronospira proteinivora TaxID=1807133 RepID=A0ABT1G4W6_9GAMM|nr:molecular chaperone HtpG [Natronospira proteinivora]MCP1726334.1 molecular chaperone HtpG [Natronospira proteinivora]